ncbi:MAG: hypothetical protein P3B98_04000 [Gemmatimonadota bacterium]|nr:hypothetical protein [Gemmatimonadota bacterium]
MRARLWRFRLLALAVLPLVAPAVVGAQRPQYGPTLYWESGLIDIPAAWIAPLTGDLAINVSRIGFDSVGQSTVKRGPELNVSVATALFKRAEVGVTIFSSALDAAAFGKLLLWNQLDGEYLTGLVHWLPSAAVGVRNLSSIKRLDRWARSGNLPPGVSTAPSIYGVVTRTLVLSRTEDKRPKVQFGATAGFGTGLFREDGDLGFDYSRNKTSGVFGGGKLDIRTGRFAVLSLMAESNAWDFNVGALWEVRGLRVGFSVTELGAGSAAVTPHYPVGYQKINLQLGWQTNVVGLVRGNRLERQAEQMERRSQELMREMTATEGRIASLTARLKSIEGKSAADAASERESLERALREEMEALQRVRDRLQKGTKPPPGA